MEHDFELVTHGCLSAPAFLEWCRRLGRTMPQRGPLKQTSCGDQICHLRPLPGPRIFSESRDAVDPHTDGARSLVPPDLVAVHMLRPAADGGETLVCRAADFAARLDEESLALLTRPIWRFGTVEAVPVLVIDGPDVYARFNIFDLRGLGLSERNGAARLEGHGVLSEVMAALRRTPTTVLSLEAGDTLVLDNRKILHGRRSFSGARSAFRAWISRSA